MAVAKGGNHERLNAIVFEFLFFSACFGWKRCYTRNRYNRMDKYFLHQPGEFITSNFFLPGINKMGVSSYPLMGTLHACDIVVENDNKATTCIGQVSKVA